MDIVRILAGFLVCFAISTAVFPLGIRLIARLKGGQEILHYVESHTSKSGTPTMGGIIFVLTIAATAFAFFSRSDITLAAIAVAVMAGYGIIGFLDDFLKVFFKRNLGLRAYQKIIFQISIAVVVAMFSYYSPYVGTSIYIPFTSSTLEIGALAMPLIVIIFLACTNCVNLTDGLDGLAGGVTAIYLAGFVAIVAIATSNSSLDAAHSAEVGNILVLSASAIGGILAFLLFNSFPAKVFMGDTGSMALGGLVAISAIFTRMVLIIPIIGIMFVLSGISVIIQVLHYKRTKKRVFLMAPLHHHFEKKGIHESKIVVYYCVITAIAAVLCLFIYLLVGGVLS